MPAYNICTSMYSLHYYPYFSSVEKELDKAIPRMSNANKRKLDTKKKTVSFWDKISKRGQTKQTSHVG